MEAAEGADIADRADPDCSARGVCHSAPSTLFSDGSLSAADDAAIPSEASGSLLAGEWLLVGQSGPTRHGESFGHRIRREIVCGLSSSTDDDRLVRPAISPDRRNARLVVRFCSPLAAVYCCSTIFVGDQGIGEELVRQTEFASPTLAALESHSSMATTERRTIAVWLVRGAVSRSKDALCPWQRLRTHPMRVWRPATLRFSVKPMNQRDT